MQSPHKSWPFDRPEQLTEVLREQGETAAESLDLLPALQRLSEWEAPQPEPRDTSHLVARLASELRKLSPVRQAIGEYRRHRLSFLLATARAQVSLLGPAFWLVSALITAVGAVLVLGGLLPDQALLLAASGPLLAYVGTVIAFRGRGMRVLELELACLPSPLQLTVARLVIVLGYDLALGGALGLVLWLGSSEQVLLLTLSWTMPLLLVAGLALVLSLRLAVPTAASVAYAVWLATLAASTATHLGALPIVAVLVLVGIAGIAMLLIASVRLHTEMHRLLPQP